MNETTTQESSAEASRSRHERLVRRLHAHALHDPHDEREVMHAPLLREAAETIERLMTLEKQYADSPLLPCPFCGCDAEIDTRRVYRDIHTGRLGDAVAIYCTNDDGCPADMGICREVAQDGTTEQLVDELTELWNRRAR